CVDTGRGHRTHARFCIVGTAPPHRHRRGAVCRCGGGGEWQYRFRRSCGTAFDTALGRLPAAPAAAAERARRRHPAAARRYCGAVDLHRQRTQARCRHRADRRPILPASHRQAARNVAAMKTPLLSAENISVVFDTNRILDEVNLALHAGEMVGLIGPNGAGKTTLLRVLANLLTPDSGTVALDDRELSQHAPNALAKRCAYLAQGAPAHWPLRVDNVVALGRLPHLRWWQGPTAHDRELIEHALQLA